MCAGAMIHARLGSLVYAAPDPKAGAAGARSSARSAACCCASSSGSAGRPSKLPPTLTSARPDARLAPVTPPPLPFVPNATCCHRRRS
jgi:hypothetical protein